MAWTNIVIQFQLIGFVSIILVAAFGSAQGSCPSDYIICDTPVNVSSSPAPGSIDEVLTEYCLLVRCPSKILLQDCRDKNNGELFECVVGGLGSGTRVPQYRNFWKAAYTYYIRNKRGTARVTLTTILDGMATIPSDLQEDFMMLVPDLKNSQCRAFEGIITANAEQMSMVDRSRIFRGCRPNPTVVPQSCKKDCQQALCRGLGEGARQYCPTQCSTICQDKYANQGDIRKCVRTGHLDSCCVFFSRPSEFNSTCRQLRDDPAFAKCQNIPQAFLTRLSELECNCTELPRPVQLLSQRCAEQALEATPATLTEILNLDTGKGPPQSRFYLALAYFEHTDVTVPSLLSANVLMQAVAKRALSGLSDEVIDTAVLDNVSSLPRAKVLFTMGNRIEGLRADQLEKVRYYVEWGGCDVWKALPTDGPRRLDTDVAMRLCRCDSLKELSTFSAKMDAVCDALYGNINTLHEFISVLRDLCISCLDYILNRRPAWREEIMSNNKTTICLRYGNLNGYQLNVETKGRWAAYCKDQIRYERPQQADCSPYLPTFTAFITNPPSPSHIEACAQRYCLKMCSAGPKYIEIVHRVLRQTSLRDKSDDEIERLGCLAFLPDLSIDESALRKLANKTLVIDDAMCIMKTTIVHNFIRARRPKVRKRDTCRYDCDILGEFQNFGIPPSQVMTLDDIECQDSTDIYACAEVLGFGQDDGWDDARARALLLKIRRSLSLEGVGNWLPSDLQLLGYIAIQLTPAELGFITGFNHQVFITLGLASGWSDEQVKILAQRYFAYKQIHVATHVNIAEMNHIFCGLSVRNITRVKLTDLRAAVAVIGKLERCRVPVLRKLAERYQVIFGDVANWNGADFSEFGIVIAGLQGHQLRGAGLKIVDFIDETVVIHLGIIEFTALEPKQLRLLSRSASKLAAARGFCPHLSKSQRNSGGHLERACRANTGTLSWRPDLLTFFLALWLALWS